MKKVRAGVAVLVRPVAGGSDDVDAFSVVVVARTPADVASVTQTLGDLIAAPDPRQVTVETSQDIASLRSSVAGTLSEHSRSSIIRSLAASVIVVTATMAGLVVLRRRDFGRRRALGASRALIIAILEIQAALIGIVGATAGAVVALVTLSVRGAPSPNVAYCASVVLLSVVAAMVGALLPASYAATRDPLVELRMP
jgi:putative ABC transport system permease protein